MSFIIVCNATLTDARIHTLDRSNIHKLCHGAYCFNFADSRNISMFERVDICMNYTQRCRAYYVFHDVYPLSSVLPLIVLFAMPSVYLIVKNRLISEEIRNICGSAQ